MRYTPSADVIVEEQGGDAFLLHVPTARYFGLNKTGMSVWAALHDGTDPVAKLAGHHPSVSEDKLRADVDHLLEQMVAAGLVTVED